MANLRLGYETTSAAAGSESHLPIEIRASPTAPSTAGLPYTKPPYLAGHHGLSPSTIPPRYAACQLGAATITTNEGRLETRPCHVTANDRSWFTRSLPLSSRDPSGTPLGRGLRHKMGGPLRAGVSPFLPGTFGQVMRAPTASLQWKYGTYLYYRKQRTALTQYSRGRNQGKQKTKPLNPPCSEKRTISCPPFSQSGNCSRLRLEGELPRYSPREPKTRGTPPQSPVSPRPSIRDSTAEAPQRTHPIQSRPPDHRGP